MKERCCFIDEHDEGCKKVANWAIQPNGWEADPYSDTYSCDAHLSAMCDVEGTNVVWAVIDDSEL